MGKITRYAGGVTALVLVGYYLGRRSAQRGDLGGTGIAALDYTFAMPKLGAKVAKQIAKAQAGDWLTDYRKAGSSSTFMRAPAYNAQAWYTAAYWMAVAARILRSRPLAIRAGTLAAKGAATYGLPGSSQLTGSAASIMAAQASVVKEAAGDAADGAQIKAILSIMGSAGSAKMVAAAQKRAGEAAWVSAGSEKTGRDVLSPTSGVAAAGMAAAHWVRAGIGLNDPNTGKPYPSWQKWVARGGGTLVALIVARIMFAPQYRAAKALVAPRVRQVRALLPVKVTHPPSQEAAA